MDWNDLRYFLAVKREGTLAGAARALGVEHTTVSRRLGALESALGTKLFSRTPEGFVLTEAGVEIVAHAEAAEKSLAAIAHAASGIDARIEGTVRLATSEGFSGFLVKRLAALRTQHPGLMVQVLSGNQPLDLTRGEADLALRVIATTQKDLLVRKIATVGWSVYASPEYIARKGRPEPISSLAGHEVIAYESTMAGIPGAQWLAQHEAGAEIVLRANSIVSAMNAALVGIGIAVLPFVVTCDEPRLVRLTSEVIGERDVFLVVHPDLAKVARVRAVVDYVVDVVKRDEAILIGKSV